MSNSCGAHKNAVPEVADRDITGGRAWPSSWDCTWGELRHAIDAVRIAAGFTTPAWSSYAPATGFVFASQNLEARQKLDEAVHILLNHNVFYSGETPAVNGKIWGYQYQQIREGVK